MPLRWVTMNHFWRSAIILGAAAGIANAQVVHVVLGHTVTAAAYVKQTGGVFWELDPKLALNAIIQDLQLAPRNSRVRAQYPATSLEERYGTHETYVARVKAEQRLVEQRLEDADRLVREADASGALRR